MQPKLIIHVADIHIRNYHRVEEYGVQLESFIKKCAEITEGYDRDDVRIVICGDLVHSKNQITNELIVFTSSFLRELEKIAKVMVISGNHDLVSSNKSRTDTLTAIFETAKFNDCMFLDQILGYESGCVVDGDIIWAVYSIHSEFSKPDIESAKEEHPDAKVVGLYHGMILGAKLQNGTKADHGLDGSVFGGCDYVMAGHVHKHQKMKRGGVEIVYPSSPIQQDYGETVSEHGFEVWNMENGTHKFIEIPSNYGMYAFEINSEEDIDNDEEKLINP